MKIVFAPVLTLAFGEQQKKKGKATHTCGGSCKKNDDARAKGETCANCAYRIAKNMEFLNYLASLKKKPTFSGLNCLA